MELVTACNQIHQLTNQPINQKNKISAASIQLLSYVYRQGGPATIEREQTSKASHCGKLIALQNYRSLQIKFINRQTIHKAKSNEHSTKLFSITEMVQLSSRRNKLSINQNHCSIIIKFQSPKRFSNLFNISIVETVQHPTTDSKPISKLFATLSFGINWSLQSVDQLINQPINQNQNQISAVSTLISIAEALQKYPKENKYLKPLLQ